jgi:hypothetical protein
MPLARKHPAPDLVLVLVILAATSACEKPGICAGKELLVEVSGNHGHTERVERKALEKGAGRFVIAGDSHEHGFQLKDDDLEKLHVGESLALRSTSMNAHVHELRVRCAR